MLDMMGKVMVRIVQGRLQGLAESEFSLDEDVAEWNVVLDEDVAVLT